ncbi:unnamed protein product [Nesidiocoris tenuis]|uniref:C2H2-type domain-containing protein n=1 Tax=Nesidiocoris tenuis TaxID=355587 RepID=A0A6H5GUC8_9HEMI|nr:unnamed protein product [Nesidiocoris tenuis]
MNSEDADITEGEYARERVEIFLSWRLERPPRGTCHHQVDIAADHILPPPPPKRLPESPCACVNLRGDQVIHQAVRPFTCLLCRRGFNQKVALQRHERTHGQIAPTFKCKYCPKTFLVGSSLQAHEKIHSGIKPYTCQYCPSRFHTSAAQRQHERVHTNERPYSCSYCPKAFKDSGDTLSEPNRAYICKYCPSSFPYFATLKRHQQSCHTNIPCPLCNVSVTEAKKLGAHIKNVHPFADYPQCTLCDSGKFADQSEFVEHMVWHGKQQQTEPRIENEAEKDKFEVVTLNDTLIKDEEIEEVIVPEVIEGVEEVYTEDTYSVSYMDGYSEEVYTEVDDTCGKEEIVEQTVITDFDVDTSTTVSIDISSQSFSCDVCHAEFNEKEALQEHVPLHF